MPDLNLTYTPEPDWLKGRVDTSKALRDFISVRQEVRDTRKFPLEQEQRKQTLESGQFNLEKQKQMFPIEKIIADQEMEMNDYKIGDIVQKRNQLLEAEKLTFKLPEVVAPFYEQGDPLGALNALLAEGVRNPLIMKAETWRTMIEGAKAATTAKAAQDRIEAIRSGGSASGRPFATQAIAKDLTDAERELNRAMESGDEAAIADAEMVLRNLRIAANKDTSTQEFSASVRAGSNIFNSKMRDLNSRREMLNNPALLLKLSNDEIKSQLKEIEAEQEKIILEYRNEIQQASPSKTQPRTSAPAKAEAKPSPSGVKSASEPRIRVRNPDGTTGTIPASQRHEALKAGFVEIEEP